MNPWLYIGAAAIAFGAGWTAQGWRWDASETERISAELLQAQENQRLTRIAVDKNRSLTNAYLKNAKVNEARAAAGALRVDELQRDIAALTGGAATPRRDADGERIAILGRLLGEAQRLANEGGERVGGLASQVTALQAYVSGVCLRP